ncbi:arginyltransferase [Endozoicomonadaceae bacterium StTr2]
MASDKQTETALYLTPPHPCSYLPDEMAQTLFLDPAAAVDTELFTRLNEIGFRRSGSHYYKPQCESCQRCISVRLPVTEFVSSRNQRRLLKKNHDLTASMMPCNFNDEIYALYEKYIECQHRDSDMYPASAQQFRDFLCRPSDLKEDNRQHASYFLCLRQKDKLVAVAVMDRLTNGLTAVYTFYDPELSHRSLGTYSILLQIRLVKALNLQYLYLGYWIDGCRKMVYKQRFMPQERLTDNLWQRVEIPLSQSEKT